MTREEARSGARPADIVCPLCRTRVEDGELDREACRGCGTAYHAECLAELGGCAVLGCRERLGPFRRLRERRARRRASRRARAERDADAHRRLGGSDLDAHRGLARDEPSVGSPARTLLPVGAFVFAAAFTAYVMHFNQNDRGWGPFRVEHSLEVHTGLSLGELGLLAWGLFGVVFVGALLWPSRAGGR